MGGVLKRVIKWPVKPIRIISLLFIIVVLAASAYLLWHHFSQKNATQNILSGAAKQEQIDAKTTTGYLASKDYIHYQTITQNLAEEYLGYNNPSNAERVMNQLFAKVPKTDVDPDSYSVMVEVQQSKNDTVLEKQYLNLYINRLKAAGNNTDATLAQKQLDKLQ